MQSLTLSVRKLSLLSYARCAARGRIIRKVSYRSDTTGLPSLETGETRTIRTQSESRSQIHIEKGDVMCSIATKDDVCNICQKDVAGLPVLSMEQEQDDTYYHPIGFVLCEPCVTYMFQCLKNR